MNDEDILRLHAKKMSFEEIMILIGMEPDQSKRSELIKLLQELFSEPSSPRVN